ncbi:hypothetical protein ScPMuIL_015041 [Solemya velum]
MELQNTSTNRPGEEATPAEQTSRVDVKMSINDNPPTDIEMTQLKEDKAKSVDINIEMNNKAITKIRSGFFTRLETSVSTTYARNRSIVRFGLQTVLLLLYLAYLSYAIYVGYGDEGNYRLIGFSIFSYLLVAWRLTGGIRIIRHFTKIMRRIPKTSRARIRRITRLCLYLGMSGFIVAFLAVDVVARDSRNLMSLIGIFVFTGLLVLFSRNRSKIPWHTVFWGMSLQFIFALLILRTREGAGTVKWIGERLEEFFSYSDPGAKFLFGDSYEDHRFVFKTAPAVIVFCVAISVLIYLGVIQFIVESMGSFLGYLLGTTPPESINTVANIFVGTAESALIVGAYLKTMTESELFVVMAGGMASIGGVAMITYISIGIPSSYIFAASVMSAPAALASSKLFFPPEQKTFKGKITNGNISTAKNIIQAVSQGAVQGLKLVSVIIVNLLAYFSIMQFLNSTVEWFGNRAGVQGLTFEFILGRLMYPVAFVMGTDAEDCTVVGQLLGVRSTTSALISYIGLAKLIRNRKTFEQYTEISNNTWRYIGRDIYLENSNATLVNGIITNRSEVIASYAMCGFASIGVMGMSIGTLGALAPSRLPEFTRFALKAFVVGTIASYYTACVAEIYLIVKTVYEFSLDRYWQCSSQRRINGYMSYK